MDKIRNSAFDIIYRTESRDYSVRYQASSDDKDVKSMFFIHSSAAAGKVFGIYATYKGNNKAMPLASIQSVSHLGGNSLTTNSIAYAIVKFPNDSTLVTDNITRHGAVSSSCDKYLDSKFPRNESFIETLDSASKGDCGFKVLAQQMYNKDKSFRVLVRALMLSTLEENKEFHTICLDQQDPSLLVYVDIMKHILLTEHSWFKASEYAQIAADTSSRPIACIHTKE
ncbi:unnamed protein product [Mucor circinelloides]